MSAGGVSGSSPIPTCSPSVPSTILIEGAHHRPLPLQNVSSQPGRQQRRIGCLLAPTRCTQETKWNDHLVEAIGADRGEGRHELILKHLGAALGPTDITTARDHIPGTSGIGRAVNFSTHWVVSCPMSPKPFTDQVLRRVRDVHGIAHSRDLARTLLSHSQRLLNSLLGIVTTCDHFHCLPHQQFCPNLRPADWRRRNHQVMAVREGTRDLHPSRQHPPTRPSRHPLGPRDRPRWRCLDPARRDMLIISPAKVTKHSTRDCGRQTHDRPLPAGHRPRTPNRYHDHIISARRNYALGKQRDFPSKSVRQLQRLSHAPLIDVAPIKPTLATNPRWSMPGPSHHTKSMKGCPMKALMPYFHRRFTRCWSRLSSMSTKWVTEYVQDMPTNFWAPNWQRVTDLLEAPR